MSRSPRRKSLALAALATAAAAVLATATAHAQFGYTLPNSDFVWNWGRNPEGANTKFEDFSVSGGEAGFRCELTGRTGFSGRMSPNDIRALEEELRGRLDFIYAVATYMNQLESQNLIDWARLACDKYEPEPSTEEEKAEREAKAKEKMQREIERRRARERD
jgi:hypothetical protein